MGQKMRISSPAQFKTGSRYPWTSARQQGLTHVSPGSQLKLEVSPATHSLFSYRAPSLRTVITVTFFGCAGAEPGNVQIGQVVIEQNTDASICSDSACQVPNTDTEDDCAEQMPDADVLRTFYDGAESIAQLFAVQNVKIVTDDSGSFAGDKGRMARKCVPISQAARRGHVVPPLAACSGCALTHPQYGYGFWIPHAISQARATAAGCLEQLSLSQGYDQQFKIHHSVRTAFALMSAVCCLCTIIPCTAAQGALVLRSVFLCSFMLVCMTWTCSGSTTFELSCQKAASAEISHQARCDMLSCHAATLTCRTLLLCMRAAITSASALQCSSF